jgi:hypothetical protein
MCSQLILSEEFGDVHLGISLLRAAKQERRKNIQTDLPASSSEPTPPPSVRVGGDESDNELLLSPTRLDPQSSNPCPNNQNILRGQITKDNVNDSSRTIMMVSTLHGVGIATCDLPMTG